jgi:hypothetical protein
MSPKDIKVGVTYYNRGAGKTTRTVLAIGHKSAGELPSWFSCNPRPNDPVVEYKQGERTDMLYLHSFAQWAGGVA